MAERGVGALLTRIKWCAVVVGRRIPITGPEVDGLTAEFHPGALKYYREVGLK